VLQAAGRSAEAEPLMRRALAIDEKNLSPDDPSIAFDLKILTGLLVDVSWKNDLPQTRAGLAASNRDDGGRFCARSGGVKGRIARLGRSLAERGGL
jgi:hypothetical protein